MKILFNLLTITILMISFNLFAWEDEGDSYGDLNENGQWDVNEPWMDINNDGSFTFPSGEFDEIFDCGDGVFGYEGEAYVDSNGNGIWDQGESYIEENGDGMYTPPDYRKNWYNTVISP